MKKIISLILAISIMVSMISVYTTSSSGAEVHTITFGGFGVPPGTFIQVTVGEQLPERIDIPELYGVTFAGFYTGHGYYNFETDILVYLPNGERNWHEPWNGRFNEYQLNYGSVTIYSAWTGGTFPTVKLNYMNGTENYEYPIWNEWGQRNVNPNNHPAWSGVTSVPTHPNPLMTFDGYFLRPQGVLMDRRDMVYNHLGVSIRDVTIANSDAFFGNNPRELYGHWIQNKFVITLDKRGGTGGTDDFIITYDVSRTLTNGENRSTLSIGTFTDNIIPPTRQGYTFSGYMVLQNNIPQTVFGVNGNRLNNQVANLLNVIRSSGLYATWTCQRCNMIEENCICCEICEQVECVCTYCGICEELTYPDYNCVCTYCNICDELTHPEENCICEHCDICEEVIHPENHCVCQYCDNCEELTSPIDNCICTYCNICQKLTHPTDECACVNCAGCGRLEQNCICIPLCSGCSQLPINCICNLPQTCSGCQRPPSNCICNPGQICTDCGRLPGNCTCVPLNNCTECGKLPANCICTSTNNCKGCGKFIDNCICISPGDNCNGCGRLIGNCICIIPSENCTGCGRLLANCICTFCTGCKGQRYPINNCSCTNCIDCGKLSNNCTCVYCNDCGNLEEKCACVNCTVCTNMVHPIKKCICTHCSTCSKLQSQCSCVYCLNCNELTNDCSCGNKKIYRVTFNTGGGSSIPPLYVEPHGIITSLPTPQREGFEFMGWYIETAAPDFLPGHILQSSHDSGRATITDVLELLKFLAGISNNVITQGGQGSRPWNASLITPASKTANRPGIADALEILKHLAGIPNNGVGNSISQPTSRKVEPPYVIEQNETLVARWRADTPNTPADVTAVSNAHGHVLVRWQAVSNIDEYIVYRSTSENGQYIPIGFYSSTTFNHNESNLTPGTTYFYSVVAVRKLGGEEILSIPSAPVKVIVSS